MNIFTRLIAHYQNQSPMLSFREAEGYFTKAYKFSEWPKKEEKEIPGRLVWHDCILSTLDVIQPDGYCVVNTCLDASGFHNPKTLPLPPEIRGHKLHIMIYVDNLNRILMPAIGGFTAHKEQL